MTRGRSLYTSVWLLLSLNLSLVRLFWGEFLRLLFKQSSNSRERFIHGSVDPSRQRILSASLFLHPGFLIIDHIHFQYNGFMFGILLWSILMAREVRVIHTWARCLIAQIGQKACKRYYFCRSFELQTHIHVSSGMNFRTAHGHQVIRLPPQPAYFIYLLRSYCMSPAGAIIPTRFISLANSVLLVFLVSLGPFVLMGQLPQLLSRLFPFTRGLNHAYWAPNAWALLTAVDRILLQRSWSICLHISNSRWPNSGETVWYWALSEWIRRCINVTRPCRRYGLRSGPKRQTPPYFHFHNNIPDGGCDSYTFGVHSFDKIAQVYLIKLWRAPTYQSFVTALTLCGYASFMFGWHVHEKAVLLILVPLTCVLLITHSDRSST